ncbi:hypothetical protein [Bacillus cereus]|uniref:hypothetical protein n=1 Tax=Bacillus cereus group TaxID=86661 RepID=UPI0022DFA13C|nr:hypothetical protein [Bacillus cereus]MCU5047582.1 hypothetical protein [Bacillus cereus]MCU5651893.1 hypothetical protein [Bacillus cereus]MDZ4464666.1 hypothetical protein [Bacillus cereus]HDR4446651.1 hypothetical protein [Bacillus cereus]
MFQVPVRRGSMKEMLIAVRDLEARGYDYVTTITKVYKAEKTFYNDGKFKGKDKIRFTGMEDRASYECWMKKVN